VFIALVVMMMSMDIVLGKDYHPSMYDSEASSLIVNLIPYLH